MRIFEIKESHRKYVVVQGGRRLSSVVSSNSMASQRMNEIFNKCLDPFVNLCHTCGRKPTSVVLVSTMWYDGGENVGTTEMYTEIMKRCWNKRNFFKRLRPVLRYTWSRIRYGLMGVMIESRRAMRLSYLCWIWCSMPRNQLVLSLPPLLVLARSDSNVTPLVFQILSSLIHIGQVLLLTRWRLVDMSNPDAPTMNELRDVLSSLTRINHLPLLWTLGWDTTTWKPNNSEFNKYNVVSEMTLISRQGVWIQNRERVFNMYVSTLATVVAGAWWTSAIVIKITNKY